MKIYLWILDFNKIKGRKKKYIYDKAAKIWEEELIRIQKNEMMVDRPTYC